jgi:ATPase subunit of ABC transporter with duplicated ATPase domains
VVVVSHDREFLRRTVTHVAELDQFDHGVRLFAGGWDAYLAERELAAQHARERYEEYADKKSSLLGRAQREREWASQGLSKAKKNPTRTRTSAPSRSTRPSSSPGRPPGRSVRSSGSTSSRSRVRRGSYA